MITVAHPHNTLPTRPPPEAWIDPRPALDAAIAAIPTLDDPDVVELVEVLALTVVQLLEDRDSLRLVLSASLTQSYALTVRIRRLEAQRNDLTTRMRSLRTAAEPCR